jgi:hypothetical protein
MTTATVIDRYDTESLELSVSCLGIPEHWRRHKRRLCAIEKRGLAEHSLDRFRDRCFLTIAAQFVDK